MRSNNAVSRVLRICIVLLTLTLVAQVSAGDNQMINIIPKPMVSELLPGSFELKKTTVITMPAHSRKAKVVANLLAETLRPATGFPLRVVEDENNKRKGALVLMLYSGDKSLGTEGYQLYITPDTVLIRAADPKGLFYGVQSLRQLLPAQIENPELVEHVNWTVPCVNIRDTPRFSWRGLMLDTSRTYQPVNYLKRQIDLLALYKMNVLHLHLTDDQGWRLEIKKYPRLTTVGSKFDVRYNQFGGFYTQDEMKDLISYAACRNVMIVPEIEMPGHTAAAVRAYPWLSCKGVTPVIFPFMEGLVPGLQPDVFCPGQDRTIEFLENVLTEVAALFPSPFIHIGGDEVDKIRWRECPHCQARIKSEKLKDEFELQSYFVKRIERFLISKHKRLMGWDEIMEGGLAPNAAVMSWRSIDFGMKAIDEGHDVVFTPVQYGYFDYTNASFNTENVYSYEPVGASIKPEQAKHVLGAQASLWTHMARGEDTSNLQLFPRLIAMSEVVWSAREARNLADFKARLDHHFPRLNELQVAYSRVSYGVEVGAWDDKTIKTEYQTSEWDISAHVDSSGVILVRPEYRWGLPLTAEWVALYEEGRELIRDAHIGVSAPDGDRKNVYRLPLNDWKPGAKYTVKASLRSEYGTNSQGVILLDKEK